MLQYYGDLNELGDAKVCHQGVVFGLKPVFVSIRERKRAVLQSDHGAKTVILTGVTKTVCYRFLPVIKPTARWVMNDGDHDAVILGGGARGCCPRSKHSMITMGLPQSGQR